MWLEAGPGCDLHQEGGTGAGRAHPQPSRRAQVQSCTHRHLRQHHLVAADIYRYHLQTHMEEMFDGFLRICLTNTKNAANTRMMRILVETVSGLRGSQMDGSEQL